MYSRNIYRNPYYRNQRVANNDRFIGPGGFIVPFVLGGIAGSALTRPNYYYPPYPYPVYYNNNYYPYNPYYNY